jgi:hypothetical protein
LASTNKYFKESLLIKTNVCKRKLFRGDIIEMDRKSFLNVSVLLRVVLLLVGLHSVILGGTIYFFTVPFHQFFFSVDSDNYFFIKQSGVFLFLAGLFYLIPVLDMKRYKLFIALVVFSKVTAVAFLLRNAHLAPSPPMVYLAALGDGLMATTISLLALIGYKNNNNGPLN